jgi:hypoxanthine phosphoribosyltransferase
MSEPTPYAYENREGLLPVTWELFHGLCKGLALAVAAYQPELILAVGRGGYYPGTLISHMLRADIYPVRLSRRVGDVVTHRRPKWVVKPPKAVKGKRVLVVDEICDTGETLEKVAKSAKKRGAAEVRTAVLYSHTHRAAVPDYIGLISDELILNPWDREIVERDGFVFHPEYLGAFEQQGIALSPELRIDAPTMPPAKRPD